MKLSEMNGNQRMAARLAWDSCGWVVGGYENQMQDNDEGSEDYNSAKEALADHDLLVDEIYDHVMHMTDKSFRKHLRFAGKEFIIDRINGRLARWGY